MRGLNRVTVSGNVSGDIRFGQLPDDSPVMTFSMASDRKTDNGTVTAWIKVNVYIEPLVRLCRERLSRGSYVLVDGELMNREGQYGKLTGVRAQEIIFIKEGR